MSVRIYAIRNRTSDLVYVGSTRKRLLCDRMAEHQADHKRGRGITSGLVTQCPTAYIELLEECDEGVRKERERWWIRNTPNCVNLQKLQTDEEKRILGNQATMRSRYATQERIDRHNAYQREWKARQPEMTPEQLEEHRRRSREYTRKYREKLKAST